LVYSGHIEVESGLNCGALYPYWMGKNRSPAGCLNLDYWNDYARTLCPLGPQYFDHHDRPVDHRHGYFFNQVTIRAQAGP
jgi:hypothetical protein